MRRLAAAVVVGLSLVLLLPLHAAAQTSGIAGEVKDSSGAVLPGVTVEVASPALIEKVRAATTDGSGRYTVTSLRPGTYSVTFTLPGFNTVKREGIELTSDFTAAVNADLKVGSVEETITVAASSPLVDVQSVTTRTVMTRDVLDTIPTGRNIQAVGIMIPGTSIAAGGGGALSRDVGGSGSLQQSPLQYRGSGDTVQTVEGLRLNNLCGNGQFSGVYWNDGSFQEVSYVTGADSAEMGQGGMRVNMVPKDGGNTFRGTVSGNYAGKNFSSKNLRDNLAGDLTFNPNNRITNVAEIRNIWDFNPSIGGPIKRDKLWFNYTFRHWGVNKTVAGIYYDADPSPFRYVPDTTRPGIDDGHLRSNAFRVTWQATSKDKIAAYHDEQGKFRDHWGISSTVPPDASAIQVEPIDFVHVTKWTRTQSNRLLFDAGVSIFDVEYTELYQPEVTGQTAKVFDIDAIRNARIYSISDSATGVISSAWNAPADHFSKVITIGGAASYVTGSHSLRFGAAVTQGDRRLVSVYSGDVTPITYNAGAPVSVTLRLPRDQRDGIKADAGIFAQDKWTIKRVTLNLGLRYDQFIGETQEEDLLAGRFNAAQHFATCADGKNNPKAGCVGTVQNWKDISPRIGVAWDIFGTGRTAMKASVARYVNGEAVGTAAAAGANPIASLGLTDVRPWTDVDRNGSPFDGAGNIQIAELGTSTATATFGKNVSTTSTDPAVLNGWGKRGYNWEYTVSAQHQLADRVSVNGGYYRRTFGNQTFTDDLRYDSTSYDGPFCMTAPGDPNLPGGGGYQVCGLYDLKPSVFAQGAAANNLIRFSDDFGGETNLYQGFDLNLDARFSQGAFLRGGIGATGRTFDNCNLAGAGQDAFVAGLNTPTSLGTEIYPDGSTVCHREYPLRPDFKLLGAYTLPFDIQFSGTYQFSRGVQTGGAGPSILATYAVTSALITPVLGHGWTGSASKNIALMREGLDYGKQNLNQLDLRASKRFRVGRYRIRGDFDLYNVFNSNWPYTVSTTFSTAATSQWLRPTNVLQARFFKLGAQIDF
ncbi:MAG TPA: carboxypeptidase regulatory-like domain-containing protein [Vicinamibacterales bacterium]|nr:carboxypeptidase regulatory-like domain-containing protein [Vicinamibacterales bacterium]